MVINFEDEPVSEETDFNIDAEAATTASFCWDFKLPLFELLIQNSLNHHIGQRRQYRVDTSWVDSSHHKELLGNTDLRADR